jgi:hypothetical protein
MASTVQSGVQRLVVIATLAIILIFMIFGGVKLKDSRDSKIKQSGTYWVHYQENPGQWQTIRTEVNFKGNSVYFRIPYTDGKGTAILSIKGVSVDGYNWVMTPLWEGKNTPEPTAYGTLSGSGLSTTLDIDTASMHGGTEPITLTKARPRDMPK